MVKITYTGNRYTRRRLPTGRWLTFRPNQTVEVKSERLTKELTGNRDFVVTTNSTPKVGAGIKTHVKPTKSRSKPPKSRAKSKVQEKVDKVLKEPKPKGLKKNKKTNKGKAD